MAGSETALLLLPARREIGSFVETPSLLGLCCGGKGGEG